MTLQLLLPNVIIAGAPKCGTTSLFKYLADHSRVCAASKKETRFLIDRGYPLFDARNNVVNEGLKGYRRFFVIYDPNKHDVVLEATPDYMYQVTPLRILPSFPVVPRVIFVLRRPSQRVYSLFRFAQNNMSCLSGDLSFAQFVEMVERQDESLAGHPILANAINHSWYHRYIEGWYRALGRVNVTVILFEDMVANPEPVVRGLAQQFGLDPTFYDGYIYRVGNQSINVRSQRIQRVKRRLSAIWPDGKSRRVARHVYHFINVSPKGGRDGNSEDEEVLEHLDEVFGEETSALQELTNVDARCWWALNA